MTIIESELGKALNSPVKRKGNNTKKLRSVAKRVSRGASEVMVKVTGFGKGAGHVKAHLNYITRNGKVDMENERGEIFSGKNEVKNLFKDWENDFSDSKRHKNQRDTMHLVLSMPETTDSQSVKNAVREFTKSTFSKNHEYVFALHTDDPHPHCHVTVKCLGFDGRRLNPKKADLQQWREGFADKLRDQGVDAEATPRRSRGVVKKSESSVIRHIERGDKTHEPRVSKVKAAKIKEVAQELIAEAEGLPVSPKPWEETIKARQRTIRRAWLNVAAALEQENTQKNFDQNEALNTRLDRGRIATEQAKGYQGTINENKVLANYIRGFVKAMPTIDTERHQLKRDLAQKFSKQPEKIYGMTVHPSLQSAQLRAEQKNNAEQAAPDQEDRGVER